MCLIWPTTTCIMFFVVTSVASRFCSFILAWNQSLLAHSHSRSGSFLCVRSSLTAQFEYTFFCFSCILCFTYIYPVRFPIRERVNKFQVSLQVLSIESCHCKVLRYVRCSSHWNQIQELDYRKVSALFSFENLQSICKLDTFD